MEILNELFKKKPKKQQQTNEREYTDLSDIQMMIQYTQRRQGLGFDDIDRRAKFQQPFVKKLKKDQIVKKQEKQNESEEPKQKEEGGKKVENKLSKSTIKIKKKQFVII
ncbi:unnamed protein product (macronuclear) [Paramecium tetraurelia]|uniref:Uncharacterized protein n=1 Tax=Paramecium tetraurelia TaxID=5888 RepID=A0BPG1_PARTE|nr:uncharacterized protein GSPATT00005177001 [Paramecium tetraurelia]CAK60428.1 unnamed protein product [Paramecium tetraurelia]|eukprot:XP_001427826.1 hypothetical protein (macronuclear) [Paramecium tetraurelia strain d4-2]